MQPDTTPKMLPPNMAVPTSICCASVLAAAAEMPAKATPAAMPERQPTEVAVEHADMQRRHKRQASHLRFGRRPVTEKYRIVRERIAGFPSAKRAAANATCWY